MGKPIIRYEAGQTPQAFEALSDSGDATTFESSFSPWSNASGYEPTIAPYGLLTGGEITPNEGTNDSVSVAALTASMADASGADSDGEISVSADNVAVTRPSVDTHVIVSITVNDSGALAAVDGSEGTSFSETRGANGGPPYIPDGSIEIGQVRMDSQSSADIDEDEIYATDGLHVERSDYPVYTVNYAKGTIEFAEALPEIHTGDIPKQVWVKGYTPQFSPVPNSSDWVPAESTYSINSTDTYDGPVGSSSSSLGQASFTVQTKDNVSDPFIQQKGENLWIEYRPDRDKTKPRQITQGIIGISRSNPAGGGTSASVTVTPREETTDEQE